MALPLLGLATQLAVTMVARVPQILATLGPTLATWLRTATTAETAMLMVGFSLEAREMRSGKVGARLARNIGRICFLPTDLQFTRSL